MERSFGGRLSSQLVPESTRTQIFGQLVPDLSSTHTYPSQLVPKSKNGSSLWTIVVVSRSSPRIACSFNRSGSVAGTDVVLSKDRPLLLPQVRLSFFSSFTHMHPRTHAHTHARTHTHTHTHTHTQIIRILQKWSCLLAKLNLVF